MERKVGEVFIYKDKTYQVVEVEIDKECKGCAFEFSSCCMSFLGDCSPTYRTDGASVIFKAINNMEIKNNQLTIDIPEGMEIDLENSDLTKGIVKFKKKDITYDDILQVTDSVSVRISTYCIDKILAISQLMNIAKYYNGDWKYKVDGGERGYMIAYDKSRKEPPYYKVDVINPTTDVYYGNLIFENGFDAKAVIDNPNFRDILDAVYKN